MFTSKHIIAAGAALLAIVVAVAGYAIYASHQKRVEQRHIAALLADTTAQLRQALAAPSKEIAARIDGNLQGLKARRDPAFADAAELYLIGAREIARRRADSERLAREAAASRQALLAHMRRAARRDTGWIRDATVLKRKVERDHADLGRSLKALDELLYSLGDAQRQLAQHLDPSLLLEDSVRQEARRRAQEEAKRAADELQKLRNITP